MKAPDSRWLPFVKMAFGFFLAAPIVAMGLAIALGKVSKESSYGLGEIIAGLSVLMVQFAQWAFSGSRKSDDE